LQRRARSTGRRPRPSSIARERGRTITEPDPNSTEGIAPRRRGSGGRQLVTPTDATDSVVKLPKAKQNLREWRVATETLIMAGLAAMSAFPLTARATERSAGGRRTQVRNQRARVTSGPDACGRNDADVRPNFYWDAAPGARRFLLPPIWAIPGHEIRRTQQPQ
jgi:hypothetical protein